MENSEIKSGMIVCHVTSGIDMQVIDEIIPTIWICKWLDTNTNNYREEQFNCIELKICDNGIGGSRDKIQNRLR